MNHFDSRPSIKKVGLGSLLVPYDSSSPNIGSSATITRLHTHPNDDETRVQTTKRKVADGHRLVKVSPPHRNIITRLKSDHFKFRDDIKKAGDISDLDNVADKIKSSEISETISFFDSKIKEDQSEDDILFPGEESIVVKDVDALTAPMPASADKFEDPLADPGIGHTLKSVGMTCCSCAISQVSRFLI